MITPNGRHLGAIRSRPDARDHRAAAKATLPLLVPDSFSLRSHPNMPEIWDQGQLGSCEAFSARRLMGFMYPRFVASPLDLYYRARSKEGTINIDQGVETRTMLKVLVEGATSENLWPYEISRFAEEPPQTALPLFHAGSYSRLSTRDDVTRWLAAGNPFTFAINLPMRFDGPDAYEHGVVAMGGDPVGWHCMTGAGYDLRFRDSTVLKDSGVNPDDVENETLIAANSWGEEWGDRGYCYIPISYVLGANGGDAWAIHPPAA